MSPSYPSLKAALAAYPRCIGLHLTLDNYPGNTIRLAFANGNTWDFERVDVEIQDTDFEYARIQTHWKVLELKIDFLRLGISEWLNALSEFKGLQRLMVQYPYGLKNGNLSLAALPDLEEIDLKEINVALTEPLPKVHTFLLDSFTAVHVPDILAKLNPQVLRQADFRHCELPEIPRELFRFTSLERLGLTGNKIQTLSPELLQLKKLTHLNLNNNRITQLPAMVMQLESLEELMLNQNPLTETTEVKGKTVLLKAIHWCAAQQTPLHQRKLLLDLMQENQAEVERATVGDLLYALGTNVELIGRKAMHELLRKVPNPFEAGFDASGHTFAVVGKVKGLPTSEIAAQLKKQGIAVETRLTSKTTLACLGETVDAASIAEVLARQLPVALPQHLKDFLMRLETPYLKESDEDTHTNLQRLLLSTDEDTVRLAAQMMLTGGIPDSLFYHVVWLGLRKGTAPWKCFRPLLERYATVVQYDFIKKYRQKELIDLLTPLFEADMFDQVALLKAGLEVFYTPMELRLRLYPPTVSNYVFFREIVKRSFRVGGSSARHVYEMQLKDQTLDLLFSTVTTHDQFSFAKELLDFPQVKTILCSFRCISMASNLKLLGKLPALKEIVIYKSWNHDLDEIKLLEAIPQIRSLLPKVKLTLENYV